jgi:flagella basal body P-ring formation protein FlgA
MTFRLAILAVLLANVCAADCVPVTTNRITGRDLAKVNPAFAGIPATYIVGIAPEPGQRRIFTTAELERVAATNRIPKTAFTEVCFEISVAKLAEKDLLAAMRRVLSPDAEVKIVESSSGDVPAGTIEFPRTSLEPPAADSGVQLWHGFVRYAETRKALIWARVSLVEHFKAVVATRDLAPNTALGSEMGSFFRVEERTGPPPREKIAASLADVAGRQVTRSIKAGDVLPMAALTAAWDVRRGDPIRVEVRSGEARLAFDAIAENPAREGDMVELRNPGSGRLFRARLEQGARAIIVLAPTPGTL